MKHFDGTDEELLEALTVGAVAATDPGVAERLGADAALRSEWGVLKEVIEAVDAESDLCAADSAEAAAMGTSPRELDVIARFRSHAQGSTGDSAPSSAAHSRAPSRVWLAAACVLAFAMGGWWLSRSETEPANGDYLGSDAGMVVTEPAPPFGTARWNKPAKTVYFNVRVWEVRAADRPKPGSAPVPPTGDPLEVQVELVGTEWSVESELLAGVKGVLFWEVIAMDRLKMEVTCEGWLQSR